MESQSSNTDSIEIWGGVECSIARIRNRVHDQLVKSGHERRFNDLHLFSDLGIKTIRYPLLWEKFEKGKDKFLQLHDKRLGELGELGISPIGGLLHHGSGPCITDLTDPEFPQLLAEYAYQMAKRYPWIDSYTPVNEPLTTARFSGLYGIWYPHRQEDASFARILINELKGTALAMKAIRSVNPHAGLIQTEDLCKVQSTPLLKYQAEFENHRRWLTYDILTGKVDSGHPLWEYLIRSGIKEQELEFFINSKTIPSVCGFNYYVVGERFLDENKSQYPRCYHGGNGFHQYADIEVVRVDSAAPVGFYGLLKEAWERYQLPLALSEVHLASTREEQLRWLNEAYMSALTLKKEKVDFRAITAWAFLGSFDWNSLLKKKGNYYESGVYDMRSGKPRATALAGMIKTINQGKPYTSSLLAVPGWWKRNIRKIYSPLAVNQVMEEYSDVAPLLIFGGNGSLGKALARICTLRGIVYHLVNRSEVDITSREAIEIILVKEKPWAVFNAAGFSNIDHAEMNPQVCFRENTLGPSVLAEICKEQNIKMVTISADQVFNGEKCDPYLENDTTSPLNVYGESKKKAEEFILSVNPRALIIRSSSFFNPWHKDDPLARLLYSVIHFKQAYYFASDMIISPTYIPDLVNTTLDLLIDDESGIWHLSSQDEISLFDFNKLALRMANIQDENIFSVPLEKLNYLAPRPKYSVLMSSHGITLPRLEDSLCNYLKELPCDWRTLE